MMRLDPRASGAGVRLVACGTLASTNAEALMRARGGERGPLWITAERQSGGRGRRGRAWVSELGNLYASLLLTHPAQAEHWAELSFVAALAVHDAVVEVAPGLKPKLAIKWPNDLLLSDAKFAGILVEGESGTDVAVVGIGVNCTSHPADTEFPATDLAAAGVQVGVEQLFGALSNAMLGRLAQWNGGEGFSTVRTDWLARAAGLGRPVRVRLADREIEGYFEALDARGGLVLRRSDGSATTVTAGDVFTAIGPSSN
jgi:BirA family transcriptional regulator, biotin operon repressor / biotin---[acetyl-CoA-carboxylase] ligase